MTVFINVLLMVVAVMTIDVQAQESSALRMAQTISLPNVEGRIDHMAVDVKGQRLFIAALGNNSVEILDLNTGKHLKRVSGLHEPQGVGFSSEFNKIFIANGKTGACDILDGSSFERIKSIKFPDDADNIRYDANGQRVYVGYGSGGLGIIDAKNGDHIGDIRLDAHPESFQLEKSGPRIFVNLPDSKKIAVCESRDTRRNHDMGHDETRRRIFLWPSTKPIIGCLSAFESPRKFPFSIRTRAKSSLT